MSRRVCTIFALTHLDQNLYLSSGSKKTSDVPHADFDVSILYQLLPFLVLILC